MARCNAPKSAMISSMGFSNELLRIKFGGFADELIAFAQREGQTDAGAALVVVQFRDGIGINRVFMDCIAAVAVADGITRVAGGRGSGS